MISNETHREKKLELQCAVSGHGCKRNVKYVCHHCGKPLCENCAKYIEPDPVFSGNVGAYHCPDCAH